MNPSHLRPKTSLTRQRVGFTSTSTASTTRGLRQQLEEITSGSEDNRNNRLGLFSSDDEEEDPRIRRGLLRGQEALWRGRGSSGGFIPVFLVLLKFLVSLLFFGPDTAEEVLYREEEANRFLWTEVGRGRGRFRVEEEEEGSFRAMTRLKGISPSKVAFVSRILVLGIEIFAHNFLNDMRHENDGFRFSWKNESTKILDPYVQTTLGGFANWDGQYFLHIATYGYTEERMLAFFPLFPMTLRYISSVLHWMYGSFISFASLVLMTGWLVNLVCFMETADMLYGLAKLSNRDKSKSQVNPTWVVLLFCFNPASIFFSSLYTESMFLFLTMKTVMAVYRGNPYAALPWASLSALCRSNGLLNFGFVAAAFLQWAWKSRVQSGRSRSSSLLYSLISPMIPKVPIFILFLLPFLAFQSFAIRTFCTKDELSNPSYCQMQRLPYSYVQEHYWNVGAFKYFELKQIPNFILAAPVLCFQISKTLELLLESPVFQHLLNDMSRINLYCLYEAAHGLFLGVFCLIFIHVQVSTRLILSAFPFLYLYIVESCQTEITAFRDRQIPWTMETTIIELWCFIYFVVGTVAFSLGYPWT